MSTSKMLKLIMTIDKSLKNLVRNTKISSQFILVTLDK